MPSPSALPIVTRGSSIDLAEASLNSTDLYFQKTSSGATLELVESNTIERYLVPKFKLLGSNIWEEHLIDQYLHSAETLQQLFGLKVLSASPEILVEEEVNKFQKEVLANWISSHEEHLKQNADIKTAQVIDGILLLVPKGVEVPLSVALTPSLWKVKEAVESCTSYIEWKGSDCNDELDINTKAHFQFK
ncbi:hypothetical protein BCR41DRAFT_423167 [Lobosporangium transversale]|uniref:Uncharacterized protein n=1 Tax=Lobosporangium transversale TaxID=64571 RepID=A0A1Y2GJA5_9FUNG|nr:hypothetical protein BCR41DRAFT_423167 [Lobosporangium transversale]ORZ12528.1 hypothetical protein BCR41DRAFT_423167 [Lobosporangium transversale]|eukprot:XP_021880147.1 hypothetical protein BCR41DRAFT_423167 [Lobosporangium transversale]